MSTKAFDEKFGETFVSSLPDAPGVYQFIDAKEEVVYVGKAKSLRRRLAQYRNASRKRVHRKMRAIVKAGRRIEIEEVEDEKAALLRENELIQELSPRLNVDGAFAFLYPAVGVLDSPEHTLLCFTTAPEQYQSLGLSWFGTFRSRPRTKAAFDALVDLLSLIGHREPRTSLPKHETRRGSRVAAVRRLPTELASGLPWFFAGEDKAFLGSLAMELLMKPRARRDAKAVQEQLALLETFFEQDARKLHDALRGLGKPGSFVSGEERDALFIEARFG